MFQMNTNLNSITFYWDNVAHEFRESGGALNSLTLEKKERIMNKLKEISIKSSASGTLLKAEFFRCLIFGAILLCLLMIAPFFIYFGVFYGLCLISFLILVIFCSFCTKIPLIMNPNYKLVYIKVNGYYIKNSFEISKFFAEYGYELIINHSSSYLRLVKIHNDMNNGGAFQQIITNIENLGTNTLENQNTLEVVVNDQNFNDSFETIETDISIEEKNYLKSKLIDHS